MTPNSTHLAGERQCFEGPDWRFGRALLLSLLPASHPRGEIDPLIAQTGSFLRLQASGPAGAAKAQAKYPRVATAIAWWNNPDHVHPFILLTLADCPREQIATRCGLDLQVVETVELLFLDIRDARGASSWIHSHIILPELRRGNVERATEYRAAFWGDRRWRSRFSTQGKCCCRKKCRGSSAKSSG